MRRTRGHGLYYPLGPLGSVDYDLAKPRGTKIGKNSWYRRRFGRTIMSPTPFGENPRGIDTFDFVNHYIYKIQLSSELICYWINDGN
jgi:hypothetical protein